MRALKQDNPTEFDRIANLRNGIRSTKAHGKNGLYVFCEALYENGDDQHGYQQLYYVDAHGEIITRDVPQILGVIRCGPEEKAGKLPQGHNAAVMKVKRHFTEEVKHREAELAHTLSLSQGQRYVLRELAVLFAATTDDEPRGQINILEKTFRGTLSHAVKKELNSLRRLGVSGAKLMDKLKSIYQQHNLRLQLDRADRARAQVPVPTVICSEALE